MRTKGFRHRVLSLPVEVWWALMETPPLWHATICNLSCQLMTWPFMGFLCYHSRMLCLNRKQNVSLDILVTVFLLHRFHQHLKDGRILNKAIQSQQNALLELRAESEELYQQAIQVF